MSDKIANNNKKWNKSEDQKMLSMYARHKNFEAIATELKRSKDAVQARFVKIELCDKYSDKYLYKMLNSIAKKYNIKKGDLVRYLKYAGIKEQTIHKADAKKEHIVTTRSKRAVYIDDDDEYTDDSEYSDTVDSYYSEEEDEYSETEGSEYSDTEDTDDTEYSNTEDDDTYDKYENIMCEKIYKRILNKKRELELRAKNINSVMKYMKTLNNKVDKLLKNKF